MLELQQARTSAKRECKRGRIRKMGDRVLEVAHPKHGGFDDKQANGETGPLEG